MTGTMPQSLRSRKTLQLLVLCGLPLLLIITGNTGCHGTRSRRLLHKSQLQSRQMYQHNRWLAQQKDSLDQSLQAVTAEKLGLEQANAAMRSNLEIAEQRLQNLAAANQALEGKMQTLLTSNRPSPLNGDATERLRQLRERFPEFEFDPLTGVSKFHSDLLFASGSDDLTPRAKQVLDEFARIMNQGEAAKLKVVVVGHTDDKAISKKATADRHPTNWHLSTNRANSVVLALKKSGIGETRMAATGYSMFQPLAANADERGRQQNRRVEIFVLAPDESLPGWEQGSR